MNRRDIEYNKDENAHRFALIVELLEREKERETGREKEKERVRERERGGENKKNEIDAYLFVK